MLEPLQVQRDGFVVPGDDQVLHVVLDPVPREIRGSSNEHLPVAHPGLDVHAALITRRGPVCLELDAPRQELRDPVVLIHARGLQVLTMVQKDAHRDP